ncbi:L-aspartate oxidase [Pseudoclavibacter sp. AY1H1]|uniref:L-aspartate oxidase n=1 Tax=Pseudoclavibacter sp. AY1H1 TaxID=2080584 RepID=UPI000CE8F1A0|nr:FAD-binding protein [Pseudoclavibacter sp. AY1H1]PPF35251.1 L-aspartate oxidase [Pseudoclavibacter sp. AY1H1]
MAREAGPLRVLVIGSGIAGLTAALSACAEGHDVSVVTKTTIDDTATSHAQGGIAAVLGTRTGIGIGIGDADDSVESHVRDTVAAGAGLGDRRAIEELCRSAEARILELIALGTRFDREPAGALSRGLEAAHSHARILHAFGDATGREIQRALSAAVRSAAAKGELRLLEHTFLADVAVRCERAVGAWLLSPEAPTPRFHSADAVVLATGGTGQLFAHTSNPAVATGDGIAAAARAGAQLADLEFVQFHPTVLAGSGGALISEAVRGEGAVLLNEAGERFLLGVHPDAELAPRDVVARGIADEMARQVGRPVRLDARHLGREFLERRFPSITAHIDESGLDWSRETVPVTPAAHYLMGGVVTDLSGRTSIRGLFAAGETARTGVHGANRLASNSLLEGAVFGRRVAEAIHHDAAARSLAAADQLPGPDGARQADGCADAGLIPQVGQTAAAATAGVAGAQATPAFSRGALQGLMWAQAGLHRSGPALEDAKLTLDAWAEARPTEGASSSVSDREDTNLLLLARLTVAAALARTESVGAHFRSDEHPAAGAAEAASPPASPRALPRSLPLRQKAMAH